MARIRTIKPEIWVDEKFVELSAFARLLFIGLLNFVDDDGREKYSEKKFKMQVLPADNINISELFGELRREKLIDVYEVENIDYLQVLGFKSHQKIDRRRSSKYPPPDSCADLRRSSTTEGIKDQGMDQGSRIKDQGKEEEKDFVFSGVVCRLNHEDFSRWETSFSSLDLKAELQQRDDWLRDQPSAAQKQWFNSTSNLLAKKHKENIKLKKRSTSDEFM